MISISTFGSISKHCPNHFFFGKENNKNWIICAYYRPHKKSLDNGMSDLEITKSLIEEWIELKLKFPHLPFTAVGDTNVDWNRANSIDILQMIEIDQFCADHDMHEIIKSPTHRF